jgi:hypothetical protein
MTPTIQTRSGYVNVFAPDPDSIDICDIAHALGYTCRFRGFTSRHYSVAQHSYNVSMMLNKFFPEIQMAGLLHDAAEAYLGDMPTPQKTVFQDYREVEAHLQAVICDRFGVAWPLDELVHWADAVMLHVEARALLPKNEWSLPEPQPAAVDMTPWSVDFGKRMFLLRFKELAEQML